MGCGAGAGAIASCERFGCGGRGASALLSSVTILHEIKPNYDYNNENFLRHPYES